MAKIDVLAEQTAFLLDKQKEVLEFFKNEMNSLYGLLEAGRDSSSYQNVLSLISTLENESIGQLEQDIEFLQEQNAAIKKVKDIDDPEKQDELVSLILEGGHELDDTEKFKSEVNSDAKEATENYSTMITDIKEVFNEEGMKGLEALFEAHMSEQEDVEDDDSDDECCASGEHCASDEGCDGVRGENKPSCKSCCGCDIFSGLEHEVGQDE